MNFELTNIGATEAAAPVSVVQPSDSVRRANKRTPCLRLDIYRCNVAQ